MLRSIKALCHHGLLRDTERQTATENIYVHLMAIGGPHLLFSKAYIQFFLAFTPGHDSGALVFSAILSYMNSRCRKVHSDFTGNRNFLLYVLNISYAGCLCEQDTVRNSQTVN